MIAIPRVPDHLALAKQAAAECLTHVQALADDRTEHADVEAIADAAYYLDLLAACLADIDPRV